MIEEGDLIYCVVRGTLHGQRVMNTYWYTTLADDPGTEEVDASPAFIAEWLTQFGDSYSTNLSNELTGLSVRAQLIRRTLTGTILRWTHFQAPLTEPDGQVDQNSLPSTCAAVFRRRTALAGVNNRGRIYLPGIPVTYESDSELTQFGYDAISSTNAGPLLETLAVGGVEWKPCLTDAPGHTRNILVTSALLDPVLRVQRRREIGVGE